MSSTAFPFPPHPRTVVSIAVAVALAQYGAALAAPIGHQVVSGRVVVTAPTTTQTVITQGTASAIVNWQQFSIGAAEHVDIRQPNASSVLLNRVIGNNPSEIYGRLSANGKVFLVNPNGVLFGRGSQVSVGALVASTLDIANDDFLAGRFYFSGNSTAAVNNQGHLEAAARGTVALLGGHVNNDGTILAQLGTAALVAGEKIVLDFEGDGLTKIRVDQGAVAALVANRGMIIADGGQAVMSASAAQALADTVLNQQGVVRARSLVERDGKIVLDGGAHGVTLNSGALDATGGAGLKGGTVNVLGHQVGLVGNAVLDASGDVGGGQIMVGGGVQGGDPLLRHAAATFAGAQASLRADALGTGNGGTVVLWSDGATRMFGAASATGISGGNGGLIETSGKFLDVAGARIDAAGAQGKAGTWLLDPYDINIVAAAPTAPMPTSPNFVSSASTSELFNGAITSALNAGTSVSVTTGAGGSGFGDINVNANIVKSTGGDARLSLNAARDINLASGVQIASTAGKLNVDLNSDADNLAGGGINLNPGAAIRSNGGGVRLFGQGNALTGHAIGYSNNPHAIRLSNATIDTTAATGPGGEVVIRGMGRSLFAGDDTWVYSAVNIEQNSRITSGGGSIAITGDGSQTGAGVWLNGSVITAGANGTVAIRASGSTGSAMPLRYGTGLLVDGGSIAAGRGITVSGTSMHGHGIALDGATVSGGPMLMTGIGGAGGDGVSIARGQITTDAGGIDIRGLGAAPGPVTGAPFGTGVNLLDTAIFSTVNGSVSISGQATGASGVSVGGATTLGNAASLGNITLRAFSAPADVNASTPLMLNLNGVIQTQGVLDLMPGGVNAAGALTSPSNVSVTVSEVAVNLSSLWVSNTKLGDILSTGTSVNLFTSLDGGNIGIYDDVVKTAGGDAKLTLNSARNIFIGPVIRSSANRLHVDLNAEAYGVGGGTITLDSNAQIRSNGGDVQLFGQGDVFGGAAMGYSDQAHAVQLINATIDTTLVTDSEVGGSVSIRGMGKSRFFGDDMWVYSAVNIGDNSLISSGSGHISITGLGHETGAGAWLHDSLVTTGTGALAISGTGNTFGSMPLRFGTGLLVDNATIAAGGGITLRGDSWNGHGIALDGVTVSGGPVAMTGVGSYGGDGVSIARGQVAGSGGVIDIRGLGGAAPLVASDPYGVGVRLTNATIGPSGGGHIILSGEATEGAGVSLDESTTIGDAFTTGNIVLRALNTATGGSGAPMLNLGGSIQTSGILNLRPGGVSNDGSLTETPGVGIEIGASAPQAGVFGVSQTALDAAIVPGLSALFIGSDTHTGAITVNAPAPFGNYDLYLLSGGEGSGGINLLNGLSLPDRTLALSSGGSVTQGGPLLAGRVLLLGTQAQSTFQLDHPGNSLPYVGVQFNRAGGSVRLSSSGNVDLGNASGVTLDPYSHVTYTFDSNVAVGGTDLTINAGGDVNLLRGTGFFDRNASLTLNAGGGIRVSEYASVSGAGVLNVDLNADADGTGGGTIVLADGARIRTNGGNVRLFGQGDPLGGYAIGLSDRDPNAVELINATIDTSVSNRFNIGGTVSIRGRYALGEGRNFDENSAVKIGGNSLITSGGGAIDIKGFSDAGHGVWLQSSRVTADDGAVAISGSGDTANGMPLRYGTGLLVDGAIIATSGGITLRGDSRLGHGIELGGSIIIGGPVDIFGKGGFGGDGVSIAGGQIFTGGSGIDIRGLGGAPLFGEGITFGMGVKIVDAAITTSGAGAIVLSGEATGATGLSIGGMSTIGDAATSGDITFRAFSAQFSESPMPLMLDLNGDIRTAGVLNVMPGGVSAEGTLTEKADVSVSVSQVEFDPGTLRVSSAKLGDILSTGTSVNIFSGPGEADIIISDSVAKLAGGDATLALNSNRDIFGAPAIVSTAGRLHVSFNADADAQNGGVIALVSGTQIRTNGGAARLFGQSDSLNGSAVVGYANSFTNAVELSNSIIDTTSVDASVPGGAVSIRGQSIVSGGADIDVDASVNILNSQITSGGGAIAITGMGSATGVGVRLLESAVSAGAGGTVDVVGFGNSPFFFSFPEGTGLQAEGGSIDAGGGITLRGDSRSGHGIELTGITISGDPVAIVGTGGAGGNGITIESAAISGGAAGIDIRGLGGPPSFGETTSFGTGVKLLDAAVSTSNAGAIVLSGEAIGAPGLSLDAATTLGNAATSGDITLRAFSAPVNASFPEPLMLDLNGLLQTTGVVNLMPGGVSGDGALTEKANVSVTVGEAGLIPGTLSITGAKLGDILSTGTSVNIFSGAGSGDITLYDSVLKAAGGDATLTLNSARDIFVGFGITSTMGRLHLDLNAEAQAVGGGTIKLASSAIRSNGGNVRLFGQGDALGGFAVGYSDRAHAIDLSNATIDTTSATDSAVAGSVSIRGMGKSLFFGDDMWVYSAVNIGGNSLISSGSANIEITGLGQETGTGVWLHDSVVTAGAGALAIAGSGNTSGGMPLRFGIGLLVDNATIAAAGGITLRGDSLNGHGIALDGVTVSGGPVAMTGVGGLGGDGVSIARGQVASNGGNIDIRGLGGAAPLVTGEPYGAGVRLADAAIRASGGGHTVLSGEATDGVGVSLGGSTSIGDASTTGNIVLRAFNAATPGSSEPMLSLGGTIQTTGIVNLRPGGVSAGGALTETPGVAIDIGTAAPSAGVFGVAPTALSSAIVPGLSALFIGSDTHTGAITVNPPAPFGNYDLYLLNGGAGSGGINLVNGLSLPGRMLALASGGSVTQGGSLIAGSVLLRGTQTQSNFQLDHPGNALPYVGVLFDSPGGAVTLASIGNVRVGGASGVGIDSASHMTYAFDGFGALAGSGLTVSAGGDVNLLQGVGFLGSNAVLAVNAGGAIRIEEGAVVSGAGVLNVDLNADADGTGGGAIVLADGASVTTRGGNVRLFGQGDALAGFAGGVQLERATIDTTTTNPAVAGGAVSIRSKRADGHGVLLDGSSIIAGGPVAITGIGGAADKGVWLAASSVRSATGAIDLRGRGSSGVLLDNTVLAGTSLSVSGEGVNEEGLAIRGASALGGPMTTEDIVLRGLNAGNASSTGMFALGGNVQTSAVLYVRPGGVSATGALTAAPGVAINLGGPAAAGAFHVSQAALDSALSVSPAALVIGSTSHTGAITVDMGAPLGGSYNLSLLNGGAGSLGINLVNGLSIPARNLTLMSGGSVTQGGPIAAANVLIHGTQLESRFQLANPGNAISQFGLRFDMPGGTADLASAGNVQIGDALGANAGSALTVRAGGNIVLPGTLTLQGSNASLALNAAGGVTFDAGSSARLAGAGTLNVDLNADADGTGGGAVTLANGATIDAQDGNVRIFGQSDAVGGFAAGVQLDRAVINANAVSIRGKRADGSGVLLDGSTISARGQVDLTGIGSAEGVRLAASQVTSTSGLIDLRGRGASGVVLQDAGLAAGAIVVGGEGEGGSGLAIRGTSTLGGPFTTGNIMLRAVNRGGVNAASMLELGGTIETTGLLNVRPGGVSDSGALTEATGVAINIGGAAPAGAFNLSQAALASAIRPGLSTLVVGSASHTGAIGVTTTGPFGAGYNLSLQNGGAGSGGINLVNGLAMPGRVLTLSSGGSVSQGGALVADGVLLHGTQPGASFALANAGNTVPRLGVLFAMPGAGASVNFASNGNLQIGALGGVGVDAGTNAPQAIVASGAVTGAGLTVSAGGNLDVLQDISVLGNNASLALNAGGAINVAAGTRMAGAGTLNVDLNADADGNGSGAIVIANGAAINTGGGNLRMFGQGDAVGGSAGGVQLDRALIDTTASGPSGGGSVSIRSRSNTGNGIQAAGTTIAAGGQVDMTGIAGAGGTGVSLTSSTVSSAAGAAIDLRGRGGSGVLLDNTTLLTSGSLAVAGEGVDGAGLAIRGASSLGGPATTGNIMLRALNAGGANASGMLELGGAIQTSGLLNLRPGGVSPSGALTEAQSVAINIGGAAPAGALNVSQAALDAAIRPGLSTLVVGSASHTGAIGVTTTGPFGAGYNLTLQNGGAGSGGINLVNGLSMPGRMLTLSSGGSVSQGGPLVAGGVLLHGTQAGSSFALSNTGNTVPRLGVLFAMPGADSSVNFASSGNLQIGAAVGVGLDAGTNAPQAIAASGAVTGASLTLSAGGNLDVLQDISLLANNAALALNAGGDINVAAGTRMTGAGTLNVDLNADADGTGGGALTLANGALIDAQDGNVRVFGQSDAIGGFAAGVQLDRAVINGGAVSIRSKRADGSGVLLDGSTISARGQVGITGIGSTEGVRLAASQVTSTGGLIDLRGRAGSGVLLDNTTLLTSGGLVVAGEGVDGAGLAIRGASSLGGPATTGNIMLRALNAGGANASGMLELGGAIQTSGLINLRPGGVSASGAPTEATNVTINIGGAAPAGALNVSQAALEAAIRPGLATLVVGSARHTGAIGVTTTGPFGAGYNLTLQNGGAGSGGINLVNGLAMPGRMLTMSSGGSVSQGGLLVADGVLLHGTQSGSSFALGNAGNVVPRLGVLFATPGASGSVNFASSGNLQIGSTAGVGVDAATDAPQAITASGAVTGAGLTLSAGGNLDVLQDISLLANNAALALNAGGDINVAAGTRMTGAGTLNVDLNADADGTGGGALTLANGALIDAQDGNVRVFGQSDAIGGFAAGVQLDRAVINGGAVSIRSKRADGSGVLLDGSTISARGQVGITGIGSTEGVRLAASQVTSTGGLIDLRGRAGSGVLLDNTTLLTSGGLVVAGEGVDGAGLAIRGASSLGGPATTGNIMLRALNAGGANAAGMLELGGAIQTSGLLNLRPGGVSASGALTEATNVTINIGGAAPAGALNVSQAALEASIRPGLSTLVVGSARHTGAIGVTATGPFGFDYDLTLQNGGAGSGGITLYQGLDIGGRLLTLSSGGNVIQAAPISAASLLVHGTQPLSSFQLANPGNAITRFSSHFDVRKGPASTDGDVNLVTSGNLSVGPLSGRGVDASSNAPYAIAAPNAVIAGDVVLQAGGDLTLLQNVSTLGSDITLVAGGAFLNPVNATLTPGGTGHWRIFAGNLDREQAGGLVGSGTLPNLFNCTYGSACMAALPASGNAFVYAQQVQVDIMLATPSLSRVYGAPNPAFTPIVTGLRKGDTAANAVSGTYVTAAAAGADVGNYAVTGSFVSPAGYLVNVTPGTLAVTPATLTYVAGPAVRAADGANPPFSGSVTGLVNGDTLAGATSGTLVFTTSAPAVAIPGPYAIAGSGLSAKNYIFTQAPANMTALFVTQPEVSMPIITREVAEASSALYGRNFGTPRGCSGVGPMTAGIGGSVSDDLLATEWSRVRGSPNLSNCMGMVQKSGCSDF